MGANSYIADEICTLMWSIQLQKIAEDSKASINILLQPTCSSCVAEDSRASRMEWVQGEYRMFETEMATNGESTGSLFQATSP